MEEGVVAADVRVTMKELINGQTIKFDMHSAGDGKPAGVRDLHMHKRMNGKRFKGVGVRFPLAGRADIQFDSKNSKRGDGERVIREIKNALERDAQLRVRLVATLMEEIERFSGSLPKSEKINLMRRGAEKIAGFFSDDRKVLQEMMDMANERVKIFITEHRKANGHPFFIKQDFLRHYITIGDDLEKLN